MKVNSNIVRSINNNEFIPVPSITVQNFGQPLNLKYEFDICGSWDFFGKDDYESYQSNLNTQSSDWYYRNHKVKYTLNSHGYRTKEFKDIDWSNSIVIFGCSYIFGTGVDDSHTIPSFLEPLYNIPVINMGMGGSSIQFALHNSLMLYKKYGSPKAVIYAMAGMTRYLLYQRNYVQLKLGYEDSPNNKAVDHLIPYNMINVELIRNLWRDKCNYYEFTCFPTTAKLLECDLYQPIPDDHARDLSHPGFKSNKLIAQKIYNAFSL